MIIKEKFEIGFRDTTSYTDTSISKLNGFWQILKERFLANIKITVLIFHKHAYLTGRFSLKYYHHTVIQYDSVIDKIILLLINNLY